MGSMFSKTPPHTLFKASYAPTSRAKCKKCGLVIKQGSLRLSRDVPTGAYGNDGVVTHHYHAKEACGISAAKATRCMAKASIEGTLTRVDPPTLIINPNVNAGDAAKVSRLFERAIHDFHKRCG